MVLLLTPKHLDWALLDSVPTRLASDRVWYKGCSPGSDLASLSADGVITRFFNPRTDSWSDHFRITGDQIHPLTAIGEATEQIFAFNTPERREERRGLQALKRYPLAV